MAADIAVAGNGKLHRFRAAGRQAAKQITRGRAQGHLRDQLGQVGRRRVRVNQGGVGLKPEAKGRYAGKHPVLVGRQLAQHQRQRGFIKILHVVGRNAHAHRAGPIGDFRQFGTQVVQDVLRLLRIVVSDVEQRQRRRAGIAVQRHLGPKLRQHQAGGHLPLRVGGMAVRKQFHRQVDRGRISCFGPSFF